MSEYTDYLCDVFILFGCVSPRRMFGGHGLYFDGCMFGLVAEDTLFLKVDDENLHYFTELDLPSFEYEKSDGRKTVMSYRMAPESIYEDQEEAAIWAAHAWQAARRAKAKKTANAKKAKSRKRSSKKSSNKKSPYRKTTKR